MLALTTHQLDVVRTAAYQPPRSLRSALRQRLAAQLDGRDFGDGQLHRVAHAIVRELVTPGAA